MLSLAWLVWVAVVVELCVSVVGCYPYWLACAVVGANQSDKLTFVSITPVAPKREVIAPEQQFCPRNSIVKTSLLQVKLDPTHASSWHLDMFVAGWRPGRVHNRLQRGAVGLGEWGHALACVVGWVRCVC